MKNLAKSTEKEKTGEAIHRTPYGQSCADEERTRSELGFATHALDSSPCTRITQTRNHKAAEFYRFLH